MRFMLGLVVVVAGCGGGKKLNSDREAEIAYIGLDQAVERAMRLGLKGFSEASSANIADQHEDGDVSGSMVVGGQADQGASANKGLRLDVTLDGYADLTDVDDDDDAEIEIFYDTGGDAPFLDLQLKDMPDGTLSGTFEGVFEMEGDLEGDLTLDLAIDGLLESDPDIADGVRRVSGETHVEGTATNEGGGEFEVDLTI